MKAGDRVLLPGWGGNSIKVGEDVRISRLCFGMVDDVATCFQEYFLFKDSDILAKIKE